MAYDLIIRNGTIVDGAGLPAYQADVGISGGTIAKIGKLQGEAARETLDAEGHVVAPGFIDAHTHMDAQVFWDPIGTSSCYHGVTSAIMGNCGFSLAPCAEKDKALVIRNLERAEDISGAAMEAGIKWSWSSFPEFLDSVERLPKGINYSSYVGHSALRTYIMGERAFTEQASPDDLAAMKRELAESIRAGAAGFSTSRSDNHVTSDDRPVASRLASWDEVKQLVGVMSDLGAGVFELAREDIKRDHAKMLDYFRRVKELAVDSGVPTTFAANYNRKTPDVWRYYYELADDIAAGGGKAMIQAHSRWGSSLLSFESDMPFDRRPLWRELRKRPLTEQEAALRDPETRRKLVESARAPADPNRLIVGSEVREQPDYEWLFVLDRLSPPYKSVAQVARETGKDPIDVMIDLSLEKHLKQFFIQPLFSEDQDIVLAMMRHPRSAITFSDSGAHVSQMMDSSLQTYLLAYWVREREELTLEHAVRKMTFDIASFWGLKDRGLLREGKAADFAIFDPKRVGPQMPVLDHDLPAGARRLKQKANGMLATVVNGAVLLRDNEPTGATPGRLLRGPLAA